MKLVAVAIAIMVTQPESSFAVSEFESSTGQTIETRKVKKKRRRKRIRKPFAESFEIMYGASDWKYTEVEGNGDEIMSDSGILHGPRVTYMDSNQRIFWQLDGRYIFGNTKYDGGTFAIHSDGTVTEEDFQSNSKNSILQLKAYVGVPLSNSHSSAWAIYTGLFYHRLSNPEQSDNDYDYNRTASQLYLPGGIRNNIRLGRHSSWQSSATASLMIDGVTNANGGALGQNLDLEQSGGLTLEFETGYRSGHSSSSSVGFVALGYVQYMAVPESKVTNGKAPGLDLDVGYVEPENTSLTYGLNLGISM